jgi:hypothetical protein
MMAFSAILPSDFRPVLAAEFGVSIVPITSDTSTAPSIMTGLITLRTQLDAESYDDMRPDNVDASFRELDRFADIPFANVDDEVRGDGRKSPSPRDAPVKRG